MRKHILNVTTWRPIHTLYRYTVYILYYTHAHTISRTNSSTYKKKKNNNNTETFVNMINDTKYPFQVLQIKLVVA